MKLSAIVVVVAVVTVSVACDNATIPENPITYTQITVGAGGNNFSPKNVTIAPGDTVAFIFQGGGHDVTFTTTGSPASCVSFCIRVFPTAGTFNYICTPHVGLGMVGSIKVQ